MSKRSIHTTAVHAGERGPAPDFRPVTTPIYTAVGYIYDEMQDLDDVFAGGREGYVYGRFGNPTGRALEVALAALEGGDEAVVFGSGMAALHAACVAAGVRAGASVLAAQDLYGATYALLARFFGGMGARSRFLDLSDLPAVERALAEERPAALVLEVVSNPLLKLADVPALVALAHAAGAQVIVDSTFNTPYLYRPLEDGVDYVVHSLTKYLAGHGDVLGGAVISSAEAIRPVREALKQVGGNLGPQEAYLALRGLKTFPLRMRQHCANAARVAEWLAAHPAIARVNYPGLASHPQHGLARRLFGDRGYGGMISFELRGASQREVFRFFEALQLCQPVTSLGDVYTLVLYPAHSSHRSMTAEERAVAQIGPGLVRLSVGIEEVGDIIADLDQALGRV